MILISCYSDGLDVLFLLKDITGDVKLIPRKGDKVSRTCIGCTWIGPNKFLVSDKQKIVQLCEIDESFRWIKTIRSVKFSELIVRFFKIHDKIQCESISGSIHDLSLLES